MLTVFDTHAKEIMVFSVNVNGSEHKIDMLRELMLSDHDLVDYQKLVDRMRKLPSLVAFHSVLIYHARASQAEAKEEFDIWYATASVEANNKMIQEIRNQVDPITRKPLPASLQKAPTIDQIKGRVMTENPKLWKEKRARLLAEDERVANLSALMDGLEKASRLIFSESRLLETLLNHGIEKINSSPRSKFNQSSEKSSGSRDGF